MSLRGSVPQAVAAGEEVCTLLRMTNLMRLHEWLSRVLPDLIDKHHVPGASIAISAGDDVIDLAAGVLSTTTEVDATPDSVFLIGSITKVWTATLIMQLVDEGALDLDAPVREYLPGFRVRDEGASASITVRHLLSHVAGFEGDQVPGMSTGEDSLEKALPTLADAPQVFTPGVMFSYNNAGYAVLGRIVEALRRRPYARCLHEFLLTPLGLTHAAHGADEAILYRAAVGHIQGGADERPTPVSTWTLPPSLAPAGSMLAMRPRDLLSFARMHIMGGKTAQGRQLLSDASAQAMQQRQVKLPELGRMGDSWGLGWEIFDYPGGPVVGHDGSTGGQAAFLRVVPERDVAFALLTNGGNPVGLYAEIIGRVLRDLADVEVPALPVLDRAAPPANAPRYVGTYSSTVAVTVIREDKEGRLWADVMPQGDENAAAPDPLELTAWKGDTLLSVASRYGMHIPHAFVGDDGHGHAMYLHTGRADKFTHN